MTSGDEFEVESPGRLDGDPGVCPVCWRDIAAGDVIVRDAAGVWVHADCMDGDG